MFKGNRCYRFPSIFFGGTSKNFTEIQYYLLSWSKDTIGDREMTHLCLGPFGQVWGCPSPPAGLRLVHIWAWDHLEKFETTSPHQIQKCQTCAWEHLERSEATLLPDLKGAHLFLRPFGLALGNPNPSARLGKAHTCPWDQLGMSETAPSPFRTRKLPTCSWDLLGRFELPPFCQTGKGAHLGLGILDRFETACPLSCWTHQIA